MNVSVIGKFLGENRGRILWGVGILVLVILSFWVISNIFFLPRVQTPKDHTLPNVQEKALTLTELSKTLDVFGPWISPVVRDGKPEIPQVKGSTPVVLLKENGGMRVSQTWEIAVPEGFSLPWIAMYPPEISNMNVKGAVVSLITNKKRDFKVGVGQPFILEQTPRMVYAVTRQGEIRGVGVEHAQLFRSEITP